MQQNLYNYTGSEGPVPYCQTIQDSGVEPTIPVPAFNSKDDNVVKKTGLKPIVDLLSIDINVSKQKNHWIKQSAISLIIIIIIIIIITLF